MHIEPQVVHDVAYGAGRFSDVTRKAAQAGQSWVCVVPDNGTEQEGGHDQADPEGGEDPEEALPQIAPDVVPGGTSGNQEPAEAEEAVDGDRAQRRLAEENLAAEGANGKGV